MTIRQNVQDHVGSRVKLKADKGRKKIVVNEGIIESAYPSVFTIVVEGAYEQSRRVSYSYSDILTSTVELTVCEECEQQEII
ncbi:MAG: Veg family protein [Tissierellales bacterium]|jgi:uncharacterized protein Veg|nr:Veg family protein [Tissierellales bacterium]